MKFFVNPTPAPAPRARSVRYLSLGLAAVFVILAVAQLYSFEEYPDVIKSMDLPTVWPPAAYAALLVTCEVFALPFLLAMRLSPLMRTMSMIAGWVVIGAWLKIGLFLNVSVNAVTNSGVLGATIPLAPGWWMVWLFIALGALVAWVSWGMWPICTSRKHALKERTE